MYELYVESISNTSLIESNKSSNLSSNNESEPAMSGATSTPVNVKLAFSLRFIKFNGSFFQFIKPRSIIDRPIIKLSIGLKVKPRSSAPPKLFLTI